MATPSKPSQPPKRSKKAVPMPKQEPKVRARNFNEVAAGYTEEMALEEAARCLNCPRPQCVAGCPVELDIPSFIKLIKEKKYDGLSER